jgi:hypothetical protein
MATPRPPPPQQISPQGSPAPPPPPKIHGTQYVWADARANTSAAPGSARMTSSQLPVDATQGGVVPVTTRGVRRSLQMEQQPPDITNSGRGQAAPLPVVTADSLPPAWNTQKATLPQLPGAYEAADVPAGMQYPDVPKKPGKRKKGKKGGEDDGGVIIPPDPLVAGVGPSTFSFGGPAGGGISSTGGVIPPSSPHHGGGSGFEGNRWGQGLKPGLTKSGTATPWSAAQSNTLPPIEIVPESPERGVVPKTEGTARSLSHPLPGDDFWTQKIVPSPLPTASPGRSKVAGGFGTRGWGESAAPSGMGGGISSGGGVVPVAGAPSANKKKKKREGGGGWGGS